MHVYTCTYLKPINVLEDIWMPQCLQFYMCNMGYLKLHICEETDIVCATLRVHEYMHALIVVRRWQSTMAVVRSLAEIQ